MISDSNIFVAVDFEEISTLCINDETSYPELWKDDKVADRKRI